MTNQIALPVVVLSLPTPVVTRGMPSSPAYVARITVGVTLREGTNHIHARKTPPPPQPAPYAPLPDRITGHWSVNDLPDPPTDSYYWLGTPSPSDGTMGSPAASHQWSPSSATPSAPSWASIFPFKPSVRAYDAWLPSGDVVHHPKGVFFNNQFIEHMWMDWGRTMSQPFTWLMAAMIVNFPTGDYAHYLLDAGRSPDSVGFPRLSADDCYTARTIKDDLDYRSLLAVRPGQEFACTRPSTHQGWTMRGDFPIHQRPAMYWASFNGRQSALGIYGPGRRYRHAGKVDNTATQKHRYYVMGREQDHISQHHSGQFLVFEIRYYPAALDEARLLNQYQDLASTYQFGEYRRI